MLSGVGFAALLLGTSLLVGPQMTRSNSLIWGLCGFLSFSLAPALGLAPELPGMPSPDLGSKRLWWLATVAATACGLWLLIKRPNHVATLVGLGLLLAPHVIGAPTPPNTASAVPAHLASTFAANSLALNLIFWSLIGYLCAAALEYGKGDERDHG
jgi:cobalt transporter subunit CbtA